MTGRCTQHQREPRTKRTRSEVDRELRRDLDTQAWRRLSKSYLQQNPFCAQCAREGREAVLATQVDHIVSRRKDRRRVLDPRNLSAFVTFVTGGKPREETDAHHSVEGVPCRGADTEK